VAGSWFVAEADRAGEPAADPAVPATGVVLI
jgi:hypothetical protein